MESNLTSRITSQPDQCGGKPCIRGLRIRVIDVLSLLANGMSNNEVLEEFPDLVEDDIKACLLYAIKRLNHPVIKAA